MVTFSNNLKSDMHALSSTQGLPAASLILLCYNQQSTVEEAALACLAQECAPIEIIFSDDASSDQSFVLLERIARAYRGPHTVRIQRNPINLGIAAHYNVLISQCRAPLIITAAGDDISIPSRVAQLLNVWHAHGCRKDLISSHLQVLDADHRLQQILRTDDLSLWNQPEDWLRKRPYVVGAAHAFTKRMFERFGPLAADVTYEDQIMAFRASCMGGGLTIAEPLVYYRTGGLSARKRAEDKETQKKQLLTRFLRERAVYLQIENDLKTIGSAHLFKGRQKQKLVRANLGVAFMSATSVSELFLLAYQASQVSWLWKLRQLLRVARLL